ncbi:hypothetical protein JXR01_00005 [Candidatus Kaiserbacteria bacterium]|nr:MAG: hypothetical protein JXR01_00005 [Candidatus Kaiserbacteria bacterium]
MNNTSTFTLKNFLQGITLFFVSILVSFLLLNISPFSGITIIPEQALAGGGGGGGGCFIAGTQVQLSDGTTKAIEGVVEGDVVVGRDGSLNTVIDTFTPLLGSRSLYSINGSDAFVTGGHPFLDVNGIWRAIDVAEAAKENPQLTVEPLTVGNTVVTTTGTVLITDITASIHDATTQLYNFHTNNTNTFIADSYVVHNKGGGGGGGGAGGSTGDAGGGIGGFGDGKSGGDVGDYTFDFDIPTPTDTTPPDTTPDDPTPTDTTPPLSCSNPGGGGGGSSDSDGDGDPSTCTVGEVSSILMAATDPQGDQIRYLVDWNADGVVDEYVPASGYIDSGTPTLASRTFTTEGTKLVRFRAEDPQGSISAWSSDVVFVCTDNSILEVPSVSVASGAQCIPEVAQDVSIVATHPSGGNVYYELDADRNGTADLRLPASGYVSSGVTQTTQYIFERGAYSFAVRAGGQDGLVSEWSTITGSCGVDAGVCPSCSGGTPSVSITAQPPLVSPGQTSQINWDIAGLDTIQTCSIIGSNGDTLAWDVISSVSSYTTSAITEQTTYTMSCTFSDVGVIDDTVFVFLVPAWQEF